MANTTKNALNQAIPMPFLSNRDPKKDNYEVVTRNEAEALKLIAELSVNTKFIMVPETKSITVDDFVPMEVFLASPTGNGEKARIAKAVVAVKAALANRKAASLKELAAHLEDVCLSIATTTPVGVTPKERGLLSIPQDILMDEGTGLMVHWDNEDYVLRSCALPSLYESAKISGNALGRINHAALSEVINHCLRVARGGSTAVITYGKCAAVLSDGYVPMPVVRVMEIARQEIGKTCGALKFVEGSIQHSCVSMVYELPDIKDDVNTAYKEALKNAPTMYRGVDFMPRVTVSSSDVGFLAATIAPCVCTRSGCAVRIGAPIKVDHRPGKERTYGLSRFEQEAGNVFAQIQDGMKAVEEMAKTTIYYPVGCIMGLCKRILLPQAYINAAVAEHLQFGDGPCSMHDVYLSICASLEVASKQGVSVRKRLDLEDQIAKIPAYGPAIWTEHDTPVTITGTNSVVSATA